MIDKVGIKIDPKHTIYIQINIAPVDILPLIQAALTGAEISENDTQSIHKNQAKRATNEIHEKRT